MLWSIKYHCAQSPIWTAIQILMLTAEFLPTKCIAKEPQMRTTGPVLTKLLLHRQILS